MRKRKAREIPARLNLPSNFDRKAAKKIEEAASRPTTEGPTEEELLIFRREVSSRRKNIIATWLFWFFLGLFGAHRFYLGRFRSGIVILSIDLFIGVGFVLSLALHIINALFGFAVGLAIITILVWFVVDIFLIPVMLRRDRRQLAEEVRRELVVERGGEANALAA